MPDPAAAQVHENKLRALRESRGLTQVQLAVAAKVAPATLLLAERHGIATPRTVAAVAQVLEVEPAALGLAMPPVGMRAMPRIFAAASGPTPSRRASPSASRAQRPTPAGQPATTRSTTRRSP